MQNLQQYALKLKLPLYVMNFNANMKSGGHLVHYTSNQPITPECCVDNVLQVALLKSSTVIKHLNLFTMQLFAKYTMSTKIGQ